MSFPSLPIRDRSNKDGGHDETKIDHQKILAEWKAMAEQYERETERLRAERLGKASKVNGEKKDKSAESSSK